MPLVDHLDDDVFGSKSRISRIRKRPPHLSEFAFKIINAQRFTIDDNFEVLLPTVLHDQFLA